MHLITFAYVEAAVAVINAGMVMHFWNHAWRVMLPGMIDCSNEGGWCNGPKGILTDSYDIAGFV